MTWESEICCSCGIEWAVTSGFMKLCRADSNRWFYCPNGHAQRYTESETDKLRLERDRLKQETAQLRDYANEVEQARVAAEHRANGYKGAAAKLKKRVSNGVCPCCNRSFGDLAAHMATKHAGFMAEEIAA